MQRPKRVTSEVLYTVAICTRTKAGPGPQTSTTIPLGQTGAGPLTACPRPLKMAERTWRAAIVHGPD